MGTRKNPKNVASIASPALSARAPLKVRAHPLGTMGLQSRLDTRKKVDSAHSVSIQVDHVQKAVVEKGAQATAAPLGAMRLLMVEVRVAAIAALSPLLKCI